MAKSDRFVDTIFVKEDSILEKKLKKLISIKDKVVEKEKIEKEIKLLAYELQGEKEFDYELKNANVGMFVLKDVTIEVEGLKAEIDYVIITRGYTYLVSCKDLLGKIIIDDKGKFRREYKYKGENIKEVIASPYMKAQRNKDIVMKKWNKKCNKLVSFFFERAIDYKYKPLIVVPNSKGLLKMKNAPKKIKKCTMKVDQLVSFIKSDIAKYNKDWLSSKNSMYELAKLFLDASIEMPVFYKDKYTIKEDNVNKYKVFNKEEKKELVKVLKRFRSEKSKRNKIPAYYVFTDEELLDIVDANVRTFDELKGSNILSDVKLKLHGEDIIKEICQIIDLKK